MCIHLTKNLGVFYHLTKQPRFHRGSVYTAILYQPMKQFLLYIKIHTLTLLLVLSCTPYVRRDDVPAYTVAVLYADQQFNGATLSNEPVLVLPILTKQGVSPSDIFPERNVAELFSRFRKDIAPVPRDTFEQRYLASHDNASLRSFYIDLGKGAIVAAQTSDSAWAAVDASFTLVIRVLYAAAIRSFDNSSFRKLSMEIELWSVANRAAVWRASVTGVDRSFRFPEDKFIEGCLRAAFSKVPEFLPTVNEKDW
jgi:hypothetical protein